MSQNVAVAGVQMDIKLADPAHNLARIEGFVRQAAAKGARLVVFPECAVAGYCFDSLEEALPLGQTVPGPATERISAVCRESNCFAVFGLLERDGNRLFNACVLVGPEGPIGCYRKLHLPYLGVDRFTTPGDRPFGVCDAAGVRVGMNICYDGSFPESSRVMALQGADLVVLPTNWPPGAECTAQFVVNTRALENNIYYMAVNRIGVERGFTFIGQSKICDPSGRILAEAAHDREEVLYAEIDPLLARRKKVIRIPGLHEIDRVKDRRPEMYGPIVQPIR